MLGAVEPDLRAEVADSCFTSYSLASPGHNEREAVRRWAHLLEAGGHFLHEEVPCLRDREAERWARHQERRNRSAEQGPHARVR